MVGGRRTRGGVIVTMLLGAMAAVPPGGASAQDSEVSLHALYSGNGLLNRGMYELAAVEYRDFLRDNPGHAKAPEARYGLAVSLYELEQWNDVLAELDKLPLADEFEYAAEVLMIRGQCQLSLEHPADAAGAFAEVTRRFPDHRQAETATALEAEALYKAGANDRVPEPGARYAQRWPDGSLRERVELVWGLSQMALGEQAAAAERFASMAQRFPKGAYADQVALLRAQALHRAGRLDEADARYRAVIKSGRDPQVAEALYGLGLLLHARGQYAEAGAQVDQYLARASDQDFAAAARLLRGRIWFEQGQYDRALLLFEEISLLSGDSRDDAFYWTAKCDLRQGRAAEAARRLGHALKQFPQSDLVPEMTYDRGVALVRAGETVEALEVLGEFRASHPEHALAADALQLMAVTEHQARRYGESRELCRAFSEAYPQHALAPSVLYLAAENEYLLREYAAAADGYRALLERFPDDAQARAARYRLGMSLYQQQRYDEADALLAEYARGAQTEPEYRAALLAVGDGHFQAARWAQAEQQFSNYLSFGLDQPMSDDALLKLGIAIQRQDRLEAASEKFSQLLERFDDSPHRLHAVFEDGQALAALNRPNEAARRFETVLDEDPDGRFAPYALNHMAAIALARLDYAVAASYFGRAAENRAGVLDAAAVNEALYQQGQALMSAQDFAAAVPVLERVKAQPAHERVEESSALLAIARARLGEPAAGLAGIQAVQERYAAGLEPRLRASLLYEKAWCLRNLDRPEEAAEAYEAVLRELTEGRLRERSMLELAELEVDAGRHEQAAARLRELRSSISGPGKAPRNLAEHCTYQLGLCEYHLGNYGAAVELLEEFITSWPDSDLLPAASLLAGEASIAEGRHQEAILHLERVVNDHTEHEAWGPSLLRLGDALAAIQAWPRSEAAFRRYLAEQPDSASWYQAQFGVGLALENQKRFDDAIAAYRAVIGRHDGPTAARAQFQVGECLFAQKRFDDAVRELLRVDILYAYPEWSAAALYEAGRCFVEMGDTVSARKQFEQVQAKYASTDWAPLAADRLNDLAAPVLPGHRSP